MLDIGLLEMLVLVVVTLLVVGPKDLPRVIRGFARAIARLRRMVDEFMGSVNDYVRESELNEFKEAMDKTRAAMDVNAKLDEYIDPTGELKKSPIRPTGKKPAAETPDANAGAEGQQDKSATDGASEDKPS